VLGAGVKLFAPEHYNGGVYELSDLAPHRGAYKLKVRETIHEVDYLDQVALLLVDVPEGYGVLNQWSFTSQLGFASPRGFFTVKDPRPPVTATDRAGRDVLFEVSQRDEVPLPVTPDGLSRVVVDFGPIERPQHAKLVITAWSHYEDLEGIQRPPFSAGTTIETRDRNGRWVVRKVAGKNPGDRHTWVIEIGGLVSAGDTRMRITMAHQPIGLDVLDQVLLDDSAPVALTVARVEPRLARLRFAGATSFSYSTLQSRIHSDDGHEPLIPDAVMSGAFTRYGDVAPLLARADDRFVIMAHGDELVLEFDDPPRPEPGRSRRAFLEADLFYSIKYSVRGELLADSIYPLPFHGMRSYPYPDHAWPYRGDPDYASYLETWNTRVIVDP
jgi:hypothetical protein